MRQPIRSLSAVWLSIASSCAAREPAFDATTAADGAADAIVETPLRADAARPVARLVGELHLHQFGPGAHAAGGFLAIPVPVELVRWNHIVWFDPPPTLRLGGCALTVEPVCDGVCPDGMICVSDQHCGPIEPVRYVDGGDIDATGSTISPRIHLWWDAAAMGYRSDPEPGRQLLYSANDRLQVHGGRGEFEFRTTLIGPPVVDLTEPSADAPLHVPVTSDWTIRWRAESGPIMTILVAASGGGRSAYVRCVATDSGEFVIPARLLAGLPPPPRWTRIEVDRSAEQIVPTAGDGSGVLVHATQTAWRNGMDAP